MPRTTLQDVAREVGVSVMTVSNVVNGKLSRVSVETARRVEDAVARLGYVPNAAAQSLAVRRSRLVGVLVPEGHDDTDLLASPHDVAVIGAVEAHLRRHDHHLLLRAFHRPHDVADSVRRWGLDGVILLRCPDDALGALDLPAGTPTVVLDSYLHDPRVGFIRSDDAGGGRLAAEHLLGLGHERVALCGPLHIGSRVVAERLEGFREGMAVRGRDPDGLVTVDAPATFHGGVLAGRAIARDHPEVTAVFATADLLAAGLCRGLADAGRDVPGDVSVLGYDGTELARMVTPPLSTIAQDTARKGAAAARLVLAIIGGEAPPPVEPLPATVVHRASTAAPPVRGVSVAGHRAQGRRPAADRSTGGRGAHQGGPGGA